MADVPGVLPDQVEQDPTQAGCFTEEVIDPRGRPLHATVG